MEPPHLTAFVAVVDIGSFTRAAARLRISQPTVTARVKALEHHLGSQLLERLPTGPRVTAAGAALLPYAREIIALTERARAAVAAGGEPHGHVDVGTVESLTSYRLLPMIEHIYLRYPKVQISLHSSACGETITRVREGRLDCAFFVDAVGGREDLETRILCPEPLVLVADQDHPLVHAREVGVDDLVHATLIRADSGADYHLEFERLIGLDVAVDRPRVFELDSIDAAKRSAAAGLGMALLPTVAVADELARGELHRIPWRPPFEVCTQVAWRRVGTGHPAVTALVETATKVIAEQGAE
ncbi:LysR family transcriptional regulator [Actinokineospora auranticolor]|uniref:DNA-binding transcriptional LysR family regulator n=1 Tax=Actinokineospora auranticolor TaxID=155976 RepID=A0A2S6GJX0_9PSEU|nr:LysR family transcriptional regulator [Actinokineospora auranticolor]PPK65451.1 DNA-binding transcriptional LysR family regulator [Actinokineospora auranticolor]